METEESFPYHKVILNSAPRGNLPHTKLEQTINDSQLLEIESRKAFPSPEAYSKSRPRVLLPPISFGPNSGLQSLHLEADSHDPFSENEPEQYDAMSDIIYEQPETLSYIESENIEALSTAYNNDEPETEIEGEDDDDIWSFTSNLLQTVAIIDYSSLKLPIMDAILKKQRKGEPISQQFRPLSKYARKLDENNPDILFTTEHYREVYAYHLHLVTQYLDLEHIKCYHRSLDNASLQREFQRQVQDVIDRIDIEIPMLRLTHARDLIQRDLYRIHIFIYRRQYRQAEAIIQNVRNRALRNGLALPVLPEMPGHEAASPGDLTRAEMEVEKKQSWKRKANHTPRREGKRNRHSPPEDHFTYDAGAETEMENGYNAQIEGENPLFYGQ